MVAIWEAGALSVESVHKGISQKRHLKEVTVRTVLRRLEQKGYLRHKAEGRAYIYFAVEPARSLAVRAVRQIIDRLCKGSAEELVLGLVDAKILGEAELDRIAEAVRKTREGGGK